MTAQLFAMKKIAQVIRALLIALANVCLVEKISPMLKFLNTPHVKLIFY